MARGQKADLSPGQLGPRRVRSAAATFPFPVQLITAKDKGSSSKGFYTVLKNSEKAEAHIKQLQAQRASLERQVSAAEVSPGWEWGAQSRAAKAMPVLSSLRAVTVALCCSRRCLHPCRPCLR